MFSNIIIELLKNSSNSCLKVIKKKYINFYFNQQKLVILKTFFFTFSMDLEQTFAKNLI